MSYRRRSRSPRRRRSRSPRRDHRSSARSEEYYVERYGPAESMELRDQEVAFVLGRGGQTKHKIARVSGTHLEVRDLTLTIYGQEENRERAKHYIKMVLAQRTGPVYLEDEERSDLTIVDVPGECAGYITGRGGQSLRTTEMETGTLMFFARRRGDPSPERDDRGRITGNQDEKLAVFGSKHSRCHAVLKVMSSIEYKIPGHYVANKTEMKNPVTMFNEEGEFVVETVVIPEEEYSYCVGRQGMTRKKLAAAAGCVLEYIGFVAHIAGRPQRVSNCRDYLKWLQDQRVGRVDVQTEGRTDVTALKVEAEYIGWITGARGSEFRRIEMRTRTFIFTDEDKNNPDRSNPDRLENVLVFASNEDNRRAAIRMLEDRIEIKKRQDRYRRRSRSRSPRRRRRSRSPRRHRSRSPRRRSRSRSPRRSRSPVREASSRSPSPVPRTAREASNSRSGSIRSSPDA